MYIYIYIYIYFFALIRCITFFTLLHCSLPSQNPLEALGAPPRARKRNIDLD